MILERSSAILAKHAEFKSYGDRSDDIAHPKDVPSQWVFLIFEP